MKALVTGAEGFLGRNIVEALRLKGFDVFRWVRGMNASTIERENPEYIIHAAAEIYDESAMFESNVVLTHEILKKLSQVSALKKFVYIGSSSEYGRRATPSGECDALQPTNQYEATKGCGSLLTLALAKDLGISSTVIRPYSIYGNHEPKHRFIPTILESALHEKQIDVFQGAHDFLHIEDFLSGVIAVLNNDRGQDIVNLGSGVCTSNKELIQAFEAAWGRPLKVCYHDSKLRKFDTPVWQANIEYAEKCYGWKPQISLMEGLRKYISWKSQH